MSDPQGQARLLRRTVASGDAGRRFDVLVNGQLVAELALAAQGEPLYHHDIPLPPGLVRSAGGRLEVRFVARPGSIADRLYGMRLLR